MTRSTEHVAAERRFRQLVADAELTPPDDVEYEERALVFYWNGPRVAVIVDLADPDTSSDLRPGELASTPDGTVPGEGPLRRRPGLEPRAS